jgi:hypothetical protein
VCQEKQLLGLLKALKGLWPAGIDDYWITTAEGRAAVDAAHAAIALAEPDLNGASHESD